MSCYFIEVEIPVAEPRDVMWRRSQSSPGREVFAQNNDTVFVPSNLFSFFSLNLKVNIGNYRVQWNSWSSKIVFLDSQKRKQSYNSLGRKE